MSQVISESNAHKGDAPTVRSLVVMAETLRLPTMMNLLSRQAAELVTAKDARKQSDSAAPIVMVNHLTKGMGSEVEVTLRHDLRGKPTMGTRNLSGREEERTTSRDSVKIDRTRHAVKDGDKYDVQERGYELSRFNSSDLGRYFTKLENQRTLVHLAGARGHDTAKDWVVPMADDRDFGEIMINEPTPPTQNRHYFAGDCDSLSGGTKALGAADGFDLSLVRRIKEEQEEGVNPLEPVDLSPEEDPYRYDPMYAMFITPRMWTQLFAATDGKEFNQMRANAQIRAEQSDMAIYRGDAVMFENILIRKMPYAIRFLPGKKVMVAERGKGRLTLVEQMIAANADFAAERGFMVGGQALAMAFGNSAAGAKQGARNFDFKTEPRDFDDKSATRIAWVNGCKKLSFADEDGVDTDRGVVAFDCAVPKKASDV